MRKVYQYLILAFIIILTLKVILSLAIPAPSMWSDEFFYARAARGLFVDGSFSADGLILNMFPPIYPLILSAAYIFQSMTYVYAAMKILNALLTTMMIFPAFLLAREFLNDKDSFLVSLIISVMPAVFSYPAFILSENLFYPLFMLGAYFIFKSFIKRSYGWDVVAGLSVGLLFLTRSLAIVILPAIALCSFVRMLRGADILLEIKKRAIFFTVSLSIISLWFLRNAFHYGFSLGGIMGSYSDAVTRVSTNYYSFWQFLLWLLPYFATIILGSGIIFGILSLCTLKSKDQKIFNLGLLSFFCSICFILIASHHNASSSIYTYGISGKALTRYVSAVFPLVLLTGFVMLKRMRIKGMNLAKYKSWFVFATFLLIPSFLLLIYNVFPSNNTSISYIGLMQTAVKYFWPTSGTFNYAAFAVCAIMIVSFPFISLILFRSMKIKKIATIIICIFVLLGFLNYSMASYNSYKFWLGDEKTQLGMWMDKQGLNGPVLLDEEDCLVKLQKKYLDKTLCDVRNHSSLVSFWINSRVTVAKIGDLSKFKYLITSKDLNYPILKKTSNNIKLYGLT